MAEGGKSKRGPEKIPQTYERSKSADKRRGSSLDRFVNPGSERMLVEFKELHRFISEALLKIDVRKEHAQTVAEILAYSDKRGTPQFGLHMLRYYVIECLEKSINGRAYPKVIKDFPSAAFVDGKRALGPVVGNYCIDLAMKKAKSTGVGIVVATNSNHYGNPTWYTKLAADNGMIGLTFINSGPYMLVSRSKRGRCGSNHLAFSSPGTDQEMNFETSTSKVGFARMDYLRMNNHPAPSKCGLNENLEETEKAIDVISAGFLLPFADSSGYSLSIMLEILTSVLVAGNIGPCVKPQHGAGIWLHSSAFIVINPQCFEKDFRQRQSNFIRSLKSLELLNPAKRILQPGELEKKFERVTEADGKIAYTREEIFSTSFVSRNIDIAPIKVQRSVMVL